jgi:hypothetical protein
MFFQSILYLYFYTNILGHEREDFKINYYCTRINHFLRSTSTSVELQALLCVNGSVMVFSNNHTHIQSSELKYTAALVKNQFRHHSPFIVRNYGVIYATKLHNVNTNLKLRFQCNVGNKCSPIKFGKTQTLRKNIHLFVRGFGWDKKNELKM